MGISICELAPKAYGVGLDDETQAKLDLFCVKEEIFFKGDALRRAIVDGIDLLYNECKPIPKESEVGNGVGKEAGSDTNL